MALTNNVKVNAWLDEVIPLLKPDAVELITGEKEQLDRLTAEAVSTGEFITLNQEKLPGCYLHRSDPNDVARVESRTFICSRKEEDAGPTNNWMDPKEMYAKLEKLYDGSYEGPHHVRHSLFHGYRRLSLCQDTASRSPTPSMLSLT